MKNTVQYLFLFFTQEQINKYDYKFANLQKIDNLIISDVIDLDYKGSIYNSDNCVNCDSDDCDCYNPSVHILQIPNITV